MRSCALPAPVPPSVSGHGRSCPGDITWFVRSTGVLVGVHAGGTSHRPLSDDVPPKVGRVRQMGFKRQHQSYGWACRGLAALGASLQTPSQPGEVGNRDLKNGSKMASLLGRELIDVDVSRRRSKGCEAELQRPGWLVCCWWLTGRRLQYLIMPSLGVRPDQHEMIDLPRRATKPNRNMHGAGQACRHQTVAARRAAVIWARVGS
jgi:hypothetical protein